MSKNKVVAPPPVAQKQNIAEAAKPKTPEVKDAGVMRQIVKFN